MTDTLTPDEQFMRHRPLLFSIAYEILGSVTDAEDAVQESYLRWSGSDHGQINNPRAYMAQIVARQALMLLRSASRRREEYIGPWLPEPLATDADADGPAHVLTSEDASTAMLLLLEQLTPDQRAVFVLREVFDFGYDEIASAVGKSEAAVRQINSRASKHVREHRPAVTAPPAEVQSVLEGLMAAVAAGEIQQVMDLLSPDVVAITDGGGKVNAAKKPVIGPEKAAKFLFGVIKLGARDGTVSFGVGNFNGLPTLLTFIDGRLDSVTSVEIRDGRVDRSYTVRNPDKLRAISRRGPRD